LLPFEELEVDAEHVDGRRTAIGYGRVFLADDEGPSLTIDGPGRWRIRQRPSTEFVAPPPLEIQVEPGTRPVVRFQLQRAKR
jgi:hypothetical protein